jgi:excisionase family DNA binding protein
MANEVLTPKEVAEKWRVTVQTVYNWIRSGKLRGEKRGGVWRIPASEMVIKERAR